MTTPSLSLGRPVAGREHAAFAVLALTAAVVAGVAPAVIGFAMPQVITAMAALLVVVAASLRSRPAGLFALWALWLLAPGIRRVLGLTGEYLSADPLALVPFVATAAIVGIELDRVAVPARARRLLALAAGGYLLGVPVGFAQSPPALVFALLAYGSAFLCFVLGFADTGRTLGRLSLTRALLALGPVLAAYAIYQYFAGPPVWDEKWLDSVDFVTTGAPEEGRVRVFGTLNSPGTFAGVLALGLCALLAQRAVTAWRVLGASLIIVAFVLTYVRSSWVSLFAAAIAFVVLTRGRGAVTVAAMAATGVLLVVGLGAVSSGTADAVTDRFLTLGALEEDKSANDRVELRLSLAPQFATAPLGHGLGQAGEANRLDASTGLAHSDNGYLALLYQAGPVGFLLVIAAIWGLSRPLFERVWRERGRSAVGTFLATAVVLLLVLLSAGDMLYGVTGAMFWYLLGCGYRWAGLSATAPGAGGPRAAGSAPSR